MIDMHNIYPWTVHKRTYRKTEMKILRDKKSNIEYIKDTKSIMKNFGDDGKVTHREYTKGVFYPNTKHLWALQFPREFSYFLLLKIVIVIRIYSMSRK